MERARFVRQLNIVEKAVSAALDAFQLVLSKVIFAWDSAASMRWKASVECKHAWYIWFTWFI